MPNTEDLVVATRNGRLRGTVDHSIEGFDYCAFKGIPYGKPPVGELRFKDPVPADSWSGIRDATKFGNNAAQYDAIARKFEGSEDCLYLNVYVRSMENDGEKKKAVMFWTHGGCFTFGAGNYLHFGPDYLMRKDVILVTFNYRLGIFGFLNLDDELVPGNQGLKDMVLALKWVHANIENFGGDPNNITIFGESAGAVATHYLATTPLTKGLISKVILQSGVLFNPWARLPEPKQYASKLCGNLGKNLYDSKEIFEFLMTIDTETLVQAQELYRRSFDPLKRFFPFNPTVDNKSPNPICPIPCEEAGLEGIDLPLLIGYNNKEGAVFLSDFVVPLKNDVYESVENNLSKAFEPLVPDLLRKYKLTFKDLKKFYFKDKKISIATRQTMADVLSEWRFFEGIHQAMKVQVEKSSYPTYGYRFCYNEPLTLTKVQFRFPCEGATHFDEVEYLFYSKMREQISLGNFKKGTTAYTMMERMTEMWTNFAKYGNPTPKTSELLPVEWLPLNDGANFRLLNIDEKLNMETVEKIEKKLSSIKSSLKKK